MNTFLSTLMDTEAAYNNGQTVGMIAGGIAAAGAVMVYTIRQNKKKK
jgi:hypothetical protein